MEFTPVEGTSDVSGARFVEQLPMKIAPTTVMADDGGVLDVVPLSRHRCCSLRHQAWDALGETLDLGLLDRMMMTFYRFPSWGHHFGTSDGWGMVERCFISHIDGGGYRRHGAVEARRPMHGDGLAQEEVAV